MAAVSEVPAPVDVGLILSYHCRAACGHCVYACGPQWQEWMTPDDVAAAVQVMRAWRHSFRVHLTGGEPFLRFDLLLAATQMVAEAGLPQFVETSAGWARDHGDAQERLDALRAAGMSGSPFHQETVPLRQVLDVVAAALEVFGVNHVSVHLPQCLEWARPFRMDRPVPISQYLGRLGAEHLGELLWQDYGLLSGGRAGRRWGHLAPKAPAAAFRRLTCRDELCAPHHSHFDVYGNHIPGCCGGLTTGPWRELNQARRHPPGGPLGGLVRRLADGGPYALLELVADDPRWDPGADRYAGKCHLCVEVRRHLAEHGDFPELQPRQFYQLL